MKKVLWYITVVPLTVIMIVWSLMCWVPAVLLAATEVLFELGGRYEAWCFSVQRKQYALKEVFTDALERL